MEQITVETIINAPMEKVWNFWTKPEHIVNWAFASDDWHAPSAENDLRVDGSFKTVMASRDGKSSFDFTGKYTQIEEHKTIDYIMDDGRRVHTTFTEEDGKVKIIQTFDPENENTPELQRAGWQGILENFKHYTENN